MSNNEQAMFDLDKVNGEWGRVVSQYVLVKVTLDKQVQELQFNLDKATLELVEAKAQLHRAQCDLLATQGKDIIDDN